MNKTSKTKLRKDDIVVVNAGREKGKTGKVLRVDLKKSRVYVEGLNMVKKTIRKKNQNDRDGIKDVEGSIHISNLQLYHNGKPTRLTYVYNDQAMIKKSRQKTRVSTKTGEKIK